MNHKIVGGIQPSMLEARASEERLDKIVASCRLKHALQFTLFKEIGIRPVELYNLTIRDIDLERGIISINTVKHGKSRNIKLKPKTNAMLQSFIKKHDYTLTERMFSLPKTLSKAFQRVRKRVANRFQDPEIRKIRLYDLRHYYGSMLYHKTKDLLYVRAQMGHKSISSTMKYMHLLELGIDEWVCKAARIVEEALNLV